MKRINQLWMLVAAIFLITWIGVPAWADNIETLKSFLGPIDGWAAEEADGMNMNMGQMKMTQATRSYGGDGKTVDVVLMVGTTKMPMGMMAQSGSMESNSAKLETASVDGFAVTINTDKTEPTGSILVPLAQGTSKQSMFILSFEGISSKKALSFARQFDWKAMQNFSKQLVK